VINREVPVEKVVEKVRASLPPNIPPLDRSRALRELAVIFRRSVCRGQLKRFAAMDQCLCKT
jgi:hypothetical protein